MEKVRAELALFSAEKARASHLTSFLSSEPGYSRAKNLLEEFLPISN